MGSRNLLKRGLISLGVYGPTRRLYRAVRGGEARQEFERTRAFYRQFLDPGDLCFDVGGNIGAKAEVLLSLGARVVCFEPQPHCYRELTARCGPSRRLVAVQAAVGAEPGTATLYVSRVSAVTTLMSSRANDVVDQIQTPVVTLDQAIAEHGLPRFCKIDVEGFELEVLRGLSRRIPVLSLEYHVDPEAVEKTWACLDRLAEFGPLSLNATIGEATEWAWDRWIDRDEFGRRFPGELRRPHLGYGDIFVRYED